MARFNTLLLVALCAICYSVLVAGVTKWVFNE